MYINAINNSYKPSFGVLYVQKNMYTTNQKNVINQIHDELNKHSEKFNNQAVGDFYKSNRGIDFYIEDSAKYEDSVYLAGCRGVKQIGTGIDECITYRDSFPIGTYDKEHPFKAEDIEYGIKDANKQSSGFLAIAGLVTITGLMLILMSALGLHDKKMSKEAVKPLIETIDSTAIKTNTALPDTVNLIKSVIK